MNLATEGWIFLVLLVAMPRLVTFLGETSFGLFSLAWVVIGYLAFLDIGVSRAATKFVSEHLAEQDYDSVLSIARTSFVVNLALGLAGGFVVVLAASYLVHSVFRVSPEMQFQARLVFYAVGLALPVLLVQGVFRAVLSSYQCFGWINAVNAVTTTVQWGVAAALAWKGYGVAVVVFSTVVARIIATVAYGALLFRLLPDLGLFRARNLHGLSKLLRFGSWVTVSQLVSPLLVYLDRMLIASYVSLAAVALYTVPTEVMSRLRIIPASLMTTMYPAFSERGTKGQSEHVQRLYSGSVRYLLIVMLPGILFLLVFGKDLLSIWMGPQFADQTVLVLQILGFGVLLNCMANIPYYAIQALGRPDITGKFHLFEFPLYLALCVMVIPRWGIVGAAFANSLRISVDAGLLFWAAQRYCRCSIAPLWLKGFLRIFGLSAILAPGLVAIRSAVANPWGRLTVGALAVGIYFVSVWLLLVDENDKPRIGRVMKLLSPASRGLSG